MNIVVLGGSYAGVSISHYLLKHVVPHMPDGTAYQLVLVSAASQALCRPACPRAMISDDMFPQDKLFVSIPQQFQYSLGGSFRFVQGTATELDNANRNVSISLAAGGTESLNFHALVIATGASTTSPLLGLKRDEEMLRASWATFRKALPSARSIVIAGGGPSGVETAGELGEFLNGRPGLFSATPVDPKISITVVTASATILPALRPDISKDAEAKLAKLGVTVIKNARLASVSPTGAGVDEVGAQATLIFEDGTVLSADLYIPATGTVPNTAFIPPTLLASDCRVETNPSTLRVDQAGPRIYALGDASNAARPAIHLVLDAIAILAANIKQDLLLASGMDQSVVGADHIFVEDTRETQLVPIGRGWGVGAAMGFRLPSFLVWLIKGRDYWLWTTGKLWSGRQWAGKA
jgi:apoptosis-inducing factor 2